MLEHLVPDHVASPTIGVLTPGIYNSAYFEHSFLSQQMGRGTGGRPGSCGIGRIRPHADHQGPSENRCSLPSYRRRFIDPEVFRPDSLLGVKGLMNAYKSGRLALANAPGTGIADDKVIYAFVPKIIAY